MQLIDRFTPWHHWDQRQSLPDNRYPGIYVFAHSDSDLHGLQSKWVENVIYIGMTNSVGGLKKRLSQFDETIAGKRTTHGGAVRVRYKHRNYELLVRKLFVCVLQFECNVKSNEPTDLRGMGEVLKCECDCFADFVECFGELPEFNNKSASPASPKYSLTVARGLP